MCSFKSVIFEIFEERLKLHFSALLAIIFLAPEETLQDLSLNFHLLSLLYTLLSLSLHFVPTGADGMFMWISTSELQKRNGNLFADM